MEQTTPLPVFERQIKMADNYRRHVRLNGALASFGQFAGNSYFINLNWSTVRIFLPSLVLTSPLI
jgi:hypothetical protein